MTFQKSRFLEIFPYFRKTPGALVEDILSSSRYATAPGNLILKEEGDEISEFVFLVSGEKRIYKCGTGREITLYEMGPGISVC